MNYKIVINKDNLYNKKDFSNIKLVKTINNIGEECFLEKRTLKSFLDLKKDLEKDNIFISLYSGYRSLKEQQKTIDDFTDLYGIDYTKKYVAEVGTSEHHTGLCFDIDLLINNKVISNDELVENESIFKKIISILPNYGLILRYPKGKEEITGYKYEPWHVRYLGKELSEKVYKSGKTLEEYLNITSKYSE